MREAIRQSSGEAMTDDEENEMIEALYREYERRKNELPDDLTPMEYVDAVREISDELGV